MRDCTETSERNAYSLRNNAEQRSSKNGLYNTISTIHKECYSKQITRKLNTA